MEARSPSRPLFDKPHAYDSGEPDAVRLTGQIPLHGRGYHLAACASRGERTRSVACLCNRSTRERRFGNKSERARIPFRSPFGEPASNTNISPLPGVQRGSGARWGCQSLVDVPINAIAAAGLPDPGPLEPTVPQPRLPLRLHVLGRRLSGGRKSWELLTTDQPVPSRCPFQQDQQPGPGLGGVSVVRL